MMKEQRKERRHGFTVLEIIVVLVIISILLAMAITQYSGAKDKALEREATSNLKLIAAAERVYRLETGAYQNASNASEINNYLNLMLPVNSAKWNYSVVGANATNFTAKVNKISNNSTICINETAEDTFRGGGCTWP